MVMLKKGNVVHVIFFTLYFIPSMWGLQSVYSPHVGWQDGFEVGTLASELSSLGLNPDAAINCHRRVSQTGKGINVCAVLQMNVQQGIPSYSISWWTLKTPRHLP